MQASEATGAALEALRQILRLTPSVPGDVGADEIIATGQAMLAERESEIAILKLALAAHPDALKGCREAEGIGTEIRLLNAQWSDRMEWAHKELSEQRLAAQRASQFRRNLRRSAR